MFATGKKWLSVYLKYQTSFDRAACVTAGYKHSWCLYQSSCLCVWWDMQLCFSYLDTGSLLFSLLFSLVCFWSKISAVALRNTIKCSSVILWKWQVRFLSLCSNPLFLNNALRTATRSKNGPALSCLLPYDSLSTRRCLRIVKRDNSLVWKVQRNKMYASMQFASILIAQGDLPLTPLVGCIYAVLHRINWFENLWST